MTERTPTLFDTHCHLNHLDAGGGEAVAWEDVWARAEAAGVVEALVVGIDLDTSQRAAEIAAARPDCLRFSTGLHPTETGRFDDEWDEIAALAPNAAAIGETGFDFYWDKTTPAQQERGFHAHLDLALAHDLPLVIHCRDAFDATYDLLGQRSDLPVAIMHCFAGGVPEARRALDLGLMLSFAGPVTYPKASALREAAVFAPADRILIETDTPFLPPQGFRGKRNEPGLIEHIARKLAEVRETTLDDIAAITTTNARRTFERKAVGS